MTSSVAERTDHTAISSRRAGLPPSITLGLLGVTVVVTAVIALSVGRFSVPPVEIVRLLVGKIVPIEKTWYPQEETVVMDVRMPRILLSLVIGAGLSVGGATLQAVFRNPLVSPQVIGVSSGASFGGVIVLLFGLGSGYLVAGSFIGGVVALGLVLAIGRISTGSPILMIILGGTVIGAMFNAFVSFITYIANPYTTLPSIVFWLMGSLSAASYEKVVIGAIPIVIGVAVTMALRWRMNILSLGDEDAQSLGINPARVRLILLAAIALIVSGSVAVAGVIGWVGLVIPHLARMIVGTDNRVVVPASALLGAAYLTMIDTLARSISTAEIPLGILTATIGAPFFIVLLFRNRQRFWGANA